MDELYTAVAPSSDVLRDLKERVQCQQGKFSVKLHSSKILQVVLVHLTSNPSSTYAQLSDNMTIQPRLYARMKMQLEICTGLICCSLFSETETPHHFVKPLAVFAQNAPVGFLLDSLLVLVLRLAREDDGIISNTKLTVDLFLLCFRGVMARRMTIPSSQCVESLKDKVPSRLSGVGRIGSKSTLMYFVIFLMQMQKMQILLGLVNLYRAFIW